MNELVKVVIYRWKDQWVIIPSEKYNAVALDRQTFQRTIRDHGFAQHNATPCTVIESLYILRKFYHNYPDLPVSFVLE